MAPLDNSYVIRSYRTIRRVRARGVTGAVKDLWFTASRLLRCVGLAFACSAIAVAQQYLISTVAGGAPVPTPSLATTAPVGFPQTVATDASGNAYFTSLNCVYVVTTTGAIYQLAGNARAGYSGDGGPGLNAQLSSPVGLAIDSAGNVVIADSGNNRVRKATPGGVIVTIAGSGTQGFGGDGGPAVSAQLSAPTGVAIDSAGNIYIADSGNNRVRKVTPAGIISTVAGNGTAAFAGDGGAALSGQLSATSIALDTLGDIFVGDPVNYRVREITVGGTITTIAGSGAPGYSGDGQTAVSAQISAIQGLAVDPNGNVYLADTGNSSIREVTSGAGTITTVAGIGQNAFFGDTGLAANAALSFPAGVALDGSGNIFIADTKNSRIREVATNKKIKTVAGNGIVNYFGDGGTAGKALIYGPEGLALDGAGNLYIADTSNNLVREVLTTGIINLVAGIGPPGFSGDGGRATAAQLSGAQGVAVDSAGNLFIADTGNSRVREVTSETISTVAGMGNAGFSGDGVPAVNASLSTAGIAVDKAGDLFISDPVNFRIREVSASGTISTVAGSGSQGYSGDNGPAGSAQLSAMAGLAIDSSGNLYIADSGNNCVREVTAAGVISTVAGNGTPGFSGDGGLAASAQLQNPSGVAVDASGNIYIADTNNNRVRKVTASGTITTIAGSGVAAYSGDSGLAVSAGLSHPYGLAIGKTGNIYVADSGNNAIRLLTPASQTALITGVVDAASETAVPLTPGKIVVIYGTGLGPAQLVVNTPVNGFFTEQLAGTSVSIRGLLAPIYYTSATQVAAIVPCTYFTIPR